MTDYGVMRSPAGHSAINGDGIEVTTWHDEFSTICRIEAASTGGRGRLAHTVTIGGVEVAVLQAGLAIPVGSPTCHRGWVFEVTKAGPVSDPRIVGQKYLVHSDPDTSLKISRKLDVIAVTQ